MYVVDGMQWSAVKAVEDIPTSRQAIPRVEYRVNSQSLLPPPHKRISWTTFPIARLLATVKAVRDISNLPASNTKSGVPDGVNSGLDSLTGSPQH